MFRKKEKVRGSIMMYVTYKHERGGFRYIDLIAGKSIEEDLRLADRNINGYIKNDGTLCRI